MGFVQRADTTLLGRGTLRGTLRPPLARYTFDRGSLFGSDMRAFADDSGNGNDTNQNSNPIALVDGLVPSPFPGVGLGQAAQFNNTSSQYLKVFFGAENSGSINYPFNDFPFGFATGNSFSIAVWLTCAFDSNWYGICTRGNSNGTTGWTLSVSTSNYLWTSCDNHYTQYGSGGSGTGGFALNPNQTYHVVAVWNWNGSSYDQLIYVDGVLYSQSLAAATTLTPDTDECLIGSVNQSQFGYNGILDDLCIYDYALDAGDAFALFCEPFQYSVTSEYQVLKASSGANHYSQTVTVTCTSTVTFTKSTAHAVAVACASAVTRTKSAAKGVNVTSTSAVSLVKSIGKKLAVACSGAVSYTKAVAKTLAVACTSAATFAQMKVKLVTITVGCSSAVTMSRATAKHLAIGCASAVTYTKAVAKSLAVSCTSAVALVKSTAKKLAIACASSTTVSAIRVFLVTITVGCSSAVTMSRSIGKQIAVSCGSATTMSRAISKTVAVACSGSVTYVKRITKTIAVACSSFMTFLASLVTVGGAPIRTMTVTVSAGSLITDISE